MSLRIASGYLSPACGGQQPAPKPAVQENEPPIVVDQPEPEPPADEDPDWTKKGGPGAGGGYLSPPEDSVCLSDAARSGR